MPFLAILRYELRSLWTSWLVRIWFIIATLLSLLTLTSAWGTMQSAILIASLLLPFLVFPWFLIAMILGISPVTGSRLDALADGILSRPITRHEFLMACWAARLCAVLAVFVVTTLPYAMIVFFAERSVAGDTVTVYGLITSFALVSLVLTFLVSLGFLAGTLLRRPLVAAVLLILAYFISNAVLDTFALEEFSPISLNRALPTLLRTPWREAKEEQPQGVSAEDMQAMARQASQFLSVLSGGQPPPPPDEPPNFFERSNYEDFSLLRVVLGYGIPTLAALGLATICFCWRDI
jgi:ABC-type transport system involved in multi-copper enzyme maturation permease subunit